MAKTVMFIASSKSAAARVRTFDWERVSQDLDAQGSAVIEDFLSPDECQDWPCCIRKTTCSAAGS